MILRSARVAALAALCLALGLAPPAQPALSDAPSGASVALTDAGFQPPVVRVPAGAAVTWVNSSGRTRGVEDDALAFSSPDMPPGSTYARVYLAPGSYVIHAVDNLSVKGTIEVVPAPPAPAPPPAAPTPFPPLPADVSANLPPAQLPQTFWAPPAPPGANWAVVNVGDVEGFQPQSVTIKVHNHVVFHNAGAHVHTVIGDGNDMNSGGIAAGLDYWRRFDAPGAYSYHSNTEAYLDYLGQQKYHGVVSVNP